MTPTSPATRTPPVGAELGDRVLGGWLGRIAGNMLGKPVEQGDVWTRERIDRYLREADALPLTDYLPEPATERDRRALRPEWRDCVRGRIRGSCRDDDVDYAILGLHLLETHGFGFSTEQVGDLWLLRLPYLQTFTAERAAYRNLARGLKPPLTATYDNPYQEWIGALIRADVHGWTRPGRPRDAASLARRDAVLSHTGNGVYGAMWAAALIAAAFAAPDVLAAVDEALAVIPAGSRLARTVRRVVALHDAGLGWEDTLATTGEETAGLGWIHVVPNAAVLTAGLLYGGGDFTRTIALTVRGGLDTDSNGATAGSVAGVLCGAAAIPDRWKDPLEDTVRSAVFGFDGVRISELAERTVRLARSAGP
ncbi:ADP-ribosylglycohydrolase family protein [Streptomyces scabiei]|uniref:ADP-ribosylglycohydrolase family protein n=1 Tax=Streptomyces scabiei TaxID=1930 RepID=UPI001B30F01C|nr:MULTISPECIES: ADP-ribosylglycohydrolase family protein [Streptomyces]MBP5879454.1 ADP-ribosylglycohydrolase family protein [Streptomyces sp. LBUM 1477]MBP5887289.1 ADP-ribosylglycohydrolase family protein [Streptomyces sp. LBUM 1487]MDW8476913.1 ADP-ribosylglycohydrolase family protein [Streptomyces scabiei]MDX2569637.1 ADP-ribosylglycohydrolase family protein [Streptomyces scabiei]MDX2628292.1 ADP-ribosylglycohydrolase family protein [Streptomyces scabiei]